MDFSVSQVIEFLLWGVKFSSSSYSLKKNTGAQKVPKLDFQIQFSMSKSNGFFFSLFFHLRISETIFFLNTVFQTPISRHFFLKLCPIFVNSAL